MKQKRQQSKKPVGDKTQIKNVQIDTHKLLMN